VQKPVGEAHGAAERDLRQTDPVAQQSPIPFEKIEAARRPGMLDLRQPRERLRLRPPEFTRPGGDAFQAAEDASLVGATGEVVSIGEAFLNCEQRIQLLENDPGLRKNFTTVGAKRGHLPRGVMGK
jgi:hypothetical protein